MVQDITCPSCGHITSTDINFQPSFCSKCGTNIDNEYKSETNYCPICSPNGPNSVYEELDDDDKFCPMCGKKTILYEKIVAEEN